MSTTFFAGGKDFDVNSFQRDNPIKIEWVRRIGDIKSRVRPERGVWEINCFSCLPSDAEFDNFQQQVADSIIFLRKYHNILSRLPEYGSLEYCHLDFGIWCEIGEKITQTNRFPVELVVLCGRLNIGITLSQYDPNAFTG